MARRADRFEMVWWNPEAAVFRLRSVAADEGER